ncbi:MAG TPA: hypothetical protein PKN23_04335 [Candidatus Hydrogenedentes bacterium]|nr:hypothetical protein [Candidatus Hydrogenedentota bacterium]
MACMLRTLLCLCLAATACSSAVAETRRAGEAIGVTHTAGAYNLGETKRDFLGQGADEILALGAKTIKVWFTNPQGSYPFNSDWPASFDSLTAMAKHPHYADLFAKPFKTFVLTVYALGRPEHYWTRGITPEQETDEERQFYELTRFLLETYSGTGKTFVLQHWEGDWAIRGGYDPEADPTPEAAEGMVGWLAARQRGVERARVEVGAQDVQVWHAAEVNLVLRSLDQGKPNVVNRVLPRAKLDLVSYSAWDAMPGKGDLRRALDYIAAQAPDSAAFGARNVYLGEFGWPENDGLEKHREIVRSAVETALDWGCPWIIYWQLFCNEPKRTPVSANDDCRGFWLLKPDGTRAWAWDYLHGLLRGPAAPVDLMADTWEVVDVLGRAAVTAPEAPAPRADRFVGMFYFLWLGAHGQSGPHDISKILAAHPEAVSDASHPAWGPMRAFHHWGEPLFGYYLSDDPWVIGKHAQMLADAQVDVIIFDVTNQETYRKNYLALCAVYAALRAAGERTPQIAFLAPFWDPRKVVDTLYADLYGPGLYHDLWFLWDGKPLILADPAKVDDSVKGFFTFRKPEPSYFTGPSGPDQWGWLEVFPQHVFPNRAGEKEQMTVGVAQNAVNGRLGALSEKGALGRSFHGGAWDTRPDAAWHGFNFSEQWSRALAEDPKFVFVTGWNEWIAMRFDEFAGVRDPVMFVDQFNHENSRDIEPMRGGHTDAYYHQLVDRVRRHKGARPQPAAGPRVSIDPEGGAAQWDAAAPVYRNHAGLPPRDHPGWGSAGRYVNATLRNNIVECRVARDDRFVWFLARTRDALTPPADGAWMRLFLNLDRRADTGWEGYDILVNRARDGAEATVERCAGGWSWTPAGTARWSVDGDRLTLAVPREALGLQPGDRLDFGFKWADNTQADGDILEFTLHGDAAPPGRFMYRYYEAE